MLDLSKLPKIRNRNEARAFSHILKRSGKSKKETAEIINLCKKITFMQDGEPLSKFKDYLYEGDKVKLNVDKMRNHPNWDSLQETYRDFVMDNVDIVFTVAYDPQYSDKPNLVRLIEDDSEQGWLFWDGDLLVLDETDGQFKELYEIEENYDTLVKICN